MRILYVAVSIPLLVFAMGCTDNAHETTRLSSLQAILFDGKMEKILSVNDTASAEITASCDRTITDVLVSDSEDGDFKSISTYAGINLSDITGNCRKTATLKVDVLKSKVCTLQKGQKAKKKVYFKAVSGEDISAASLLDLSYAPPIKANNPVGFGVSSAGGKVVGTAFSLQYKIGKPAPSSVNGTNFKIESVSQ